ncbi:MAG: 2-amino-4-hydroxy-6-hydroxymethyldihydropteridine diphosphokinase [SAR202 cluster bacterium Io17-Chloro-G9]|nr:MAG: 2-amino-4-hydroxy-6-hydroxymethyldihydropteridine diphosphokinase [SAR202 cluster bacterium Io17-Chloro-G9]
MDPVTVYLGLGSNLGRREDNLRRAIGLLRRWVRPQQSSPVYETAPWGFSQQPDFLNCILEAQATLTPRQVLASVKALERGMGRQPVARYGPRLIDVDILFYGGETVDSPDLQIPHPRLQQRAFVLVPLADLAPHLTHPALNLTVVQMADGVAGKEGVKLWGPPLI